MPDILFIIQNPELPSSRVRVLNLLPELEKQGFRSTVRAYPPGSLERLKIIREASKHDLVILQKKLLSPFFFTLLRRASQHLAFDFDDAIYYRHDSSETMASPSRMRKFLMTVKRADLVIAGNEILSDFAGQFSDQVVIVPSAIETRNVPVKDHSTETGKTVIGWVGGRNNLIHLDLISPALKGLAGKYPIELRILSSQTLEIPGVETRFIPWELETQALEIADFDIGIMPLPDNIHTRGKCGYKALQYMAAGVPPVVSDVGVNAMIVKHDHEGLVVPTLDGFSEALESLVLDPHLRENMGVKSRDKANNEYSLHVVGRKYADILQRYLAGVKLQN